MVMRKPAPACGPFEFDIARSLLFRDDTPVALGQRAVALLGLLFKHRGEGLTKEELSTRPDLGVTVEEAHLSVTEG